MEPSDEYIYIQILFYALVAFLKKLGVINRK